MPGELVATAATTARQLRAASSASVTARIRLLVLLVVSVRRLTAVAERAVTYGARDGRALPILDMHRRQSKTVKGATRVCGTVSQCTVCTITA